MTDEKLAPPSTPITSFPPADRPEHLASVGEVRQSASRSLPCGDFHARMGDRVSPQPGRNYVVIVSIRSASHCKALRRSSAYSAWV